MFLDTPLLRLHPLTLGELVLYLSNDGSLEKQLKIKPQPRVFEEEFADLLETYFIPKVRQHQSHYLFYSIWVLILKEKQVLVGDLCLKGEPNEEGEVEIGYSTYPEYQQRGFMSDAVGALVAWCLQQPGILAVMAETDTGNAASEKVLERNLFYRECQARDNTWWKRDVVD